MNELDSYINRVKRLPPAPRVLPQLLQLLREPEVPSEKVVNLITYDPALTASVLQLCNSAFFGLSTPVSNLTEAVSQIGFQQIYQLVVAASSSRTLAPPQKGYAIDQGQLWKHSVTAALAAQLLARAQGEDDGVVFTAGLLHDLGKIILSEALERNYDDLLAEAKNTDTPLLDIERKILGVDHAQVGGRLLDRWKFPANMVAAVWFHHTPRAAGEHERLASYIYFGNVIAHLLGHTYGHKSMALQGRGEVLKTLGITQADLEKYLFLTVDELSRVESIFNVRSDAAMA